MDDEELDTIDVPSHFLCPISLHLMRDPVTLSTGISFDRPSIDHWLRNKRNKNSPAVCPVTKQPLSSADLTPNHTLRRLIQSWCTLHSLSRIPTPTVKPSALDRLNSLVSLLLNPSTTGNDAVEALAVLADIDASDDELKSIMSAERGEDLVDRLTWFLQSVNADDDSSRFSSIKLLKSLYTAADPGSLTAVKPELFSAIVTLLRDHDRVALQATKWALKLLMELNPWGRNRVKAVNAGATEALIEILVDGAGQKRVCELVMAVLDQLCGCAEGRAGLVGHGAGLAVVSKRILRVSSAVSDRAVRILGSVSKNAANGGVLAEMVQVGVVAKLCLVMQVDCSAKTKERAKEILRAHSRVWKNSPCIPPHLLPSYPS